MDEWNLQHRIPTFPMLLVWENDKPTFHRCLVFIKNLTPSASITYWRMRVHMFITKHLQALYKITNILKAQKIQTLHIFLSKCLRVVRGTSKYGVRTGSSILAFTIKWNLTYRGPRGCRWQKVCSFLIPRSFKGKMSRQGILMFSFSNYRRLIFIK